MKLIVIEIPTLKRVSLSCETTNILLIEQFSMRGSHPWRLSRTFPPSYTTSSRILVPTKGFETLTYTMQHFLEIYFRFFLFPLSNPSFLQIFNNVSKHMRTLHFFKVLPRPFPRKNVARCSSYKKVYVMTYCIKLILTSGFLVEL